MISKKISNNKNYSKNQKIGLFLVFMMLFLTSSYVVCNNIWSSAITILLWGVVLFTLIYRKFTINKNVFAICIALLLCMGINKVIYSEDMRVYFSLSFAMICILLFVSNYSFEEFREYYIQIMSYICIISLVGYLAYLLVPSLQNINIVNNASNLVIYVDSRSNNRNAGLFWEPGAFQTFINLALLLEITKPHLVNIKRIVLFIITVVTTYSTTGYIGLILILLLVFCNFGTDKRNVKIIISFIIICASVFIYFNPELFFGQSLSSGQATVFGKIINFFENGNSNTISSADVRYNAVFEVARAWKERPFLGWGYQGLIERTYAYTLGMNTCTFLNWFATYGILYGMIIFFGIFKLSFTIGPNLFSKWIILLIFFIVTMSENYVQNAAIILFAFYGWLSTRKNALIEKDIKVFSENIVLRDKEINSNESRINK